MKTVLLYKLVFALFLMPITTMAHEKDWKGKHTKEKKISKEFKVNANANLKVDNSYGDIDITTWNENRIVIDVIITTNGNDEEKVQKKLNEIDVEFSASSSEVSARTRFNKGKSKSWWNWGNNNVNMKIEYIIKMPMTNSVDLDNDYGSINLDKLEGRAVINCDYGKITTKELMADNNYINFDYTNNSYFEYIKSGKIDADYSGYTVGKTNDLDINADYTKSNIEIAEDVTYNCDYGSLTIDKANNVSGDGDYLSVRLGDIYKNVRVEADYGSLKINNMTANAGNITVNSDYMKITIGYDPAYSFDYAIDLQYASLRGDDDFENTKKNIKSSSKYYSGHYGSKNSGNLIKINSDYGSVTFHKN
ncbi:MAG: hypothetical protein KJP20_06445 [Bacteroidia bacterium]|nr:hypothetical protein [Bacteroidia bacterium]NND24833.1 hypothetical protein [Flavobacteriaceae bacterium]NNK59425.1 hypothetical protein [Flavobacteriaceae bacterium]